MIEKALSEKPQAVGADILFSAPKEDTLTDGKLQQLFERQNKLVMAYDLAIEKGKAEPRGFLYEKSLHKGYANFVGEEGGTIRFFSPKIKKQGKAYHSFSSEIIKIAYPEAYNKLASRNNETEQVNYTCTPEKFILVNGTDYLQNEGAAVSLSGKIVLLGYVSPDENQLEDKHFTPLNKKSVGKTVPDMQGIFIHANIISMLKGNNYISKFPVWINWLIASLLCWLSMGLYIRYFLDKHLWFHLVAKLAQLLSAILFVYIGLLFYFKWDVKVNLTPTLVAIILAVDVLYFYEAISVWLHKRFGARSLFIIAHQH